MLRKDPVLIGWTLTLLAAVTITAAFCCWYLTCSRQLQNLQREIVAINRNRAILQALGNECIEYSKNNPAINPILLKVGLKGKLDPSGSASPNLNAKQ